MSNNSHGIQLTGRESALLHRHRLLARQGHGRKDRREGWLCASAGEIQLKVSLLIQKPLALLHYHHIQ